MRLELLERTLLGSNINIQSHCILKVCFVRQVYRGDLLAMAMV